MNEISSFFHMGGYGGYIWSAYAVTTVVLVANVIAARKHFKNQMRHARQQQTLRQRRKEKASK